MNPNRLILLLPLLLIGCSDPNEGKDDMQYSVDIQPIFDTHCANSGCHLNPTGMVGHNEHDGESDHQHNNLLDLSAYEKVAAGSERHGNVVIPYSPSMSHLFQHVNTDTTISPYISHESLDIHVALSDNDVNKIRKWIASGAKNDAGQVMYSHSGNGTFIITNQGEDLVSFIDIQTGAIAKIVSVNPPVYPPPTGAPYAPHYISVDNQSKFAYVTLYVKGELLKINLKSREIVGRIFLGGTPAHVEIFPNGQKAAVTNFSSLNTLHIIDLNTFTLDRNIENLKANPHALAIMPDNNTLYTAGNTSDLLYKINLETTEITSSPLDPSIPVTGSTTPQLGPYQILFRESNETLIVGCRLSNELRIWDISADSLISTVLTGETPLLMDMSPDENELWVANQGDQTVTIVNLVNLSTETLSNLPNQPHGIFITPDGQYVGLTCENQTGGQNQHHPTSRGGSPGHLVIFERQTRSIIHNRTVGSFAAGINFIP